MLVSLFTYKKVINEFPSSAKQRLIIITDALNTFSEKSSFKIFGKMEYYKESIDTVVKAFIAI